MLEDVPGGDMSAAAGGLSSGTTLSWAFDVIEFGSLLP